MTKRKRGGGGGGRDSGAARTLSSSIPAAARKEPGVTPALSSNWLQLQATLGKQGEGANARKRSKTEAPAAKSSGSDADKYPVNLLPTSSDCSVTRVLALDCEMVGVGPDGRRNALARVSVGLPSSFPVTHVDKISVPEVGSIGKVNEWGNVVYDKHVRPPEFVTDFRTQVSGVRAGYLRKAQDFFTVQKEVSELLNNRILVGHALHNDLKVLLLSHPWKDIRDTQQYGPFRSVLGHAQSLKHLAGLHLGTNIQQGEHDSIEDARAALRLYQKSKEVWEENLKQQRRGAHFKGKSAGVG